MELEWSEVLKDAIEAVLDDVHTALPGKIVEYKPDKKQVSVQPLIKKVFAGGEAVSMPIISSVPVLFPGTNDALISFPLKKGDGCLLIFSERSLEKWLSSNMDEVEPGSSRKFHLTDAFCIPGLFSFGKPGKVGKGDGLEILYKKASIKIDDNGQVNINDGTLTVDL